MLVCGMLFSDTADDKLDMLAEHLRNCESCKHAARIARRLSARKAGLVKSNKKAKASKVNGWIGGRPIFVDE